MKQQYFKGLLVIFFALFLVNCSGHANHSSDTTKKSKVSTDPKKEAVIKPQPEDDPEPSPEEIYNDLMKRYNEVIKIDTTFILNGHDTVTAKFTHYCTFDGNINLPDQYLVDFHLKKFQTHDFESKLELKLNSKTIFNSKITKKDFIILADEYLGKYGTLFFPSVRTSQTGKSISIHYSFVIPLTDVGKGVSMEIDTLGKTCITD